MCLRGKHFKLSQFTEKWPTCMKQGSAKLLVTVLEKKLISSKFRIFSSRYLSPKSPCFLYCPCGTLISRHAISMWTHIIYMNTPTEKHDFYFL